MRTGVICRQEGYLTAALIVWALLLHGCFAVSAGALWRDEANSALQAHLPTWQSIWDSLRYDSFPVLYPAVLRICSSHEWSAGDAGLRLFGSLVGLGILGSIWAVGRLLTSRASIIALALLAVDPLVISEGDSIRPYGLGLLCLLWTFGALGRCLTKPSGAWFGIAAVASIMCVQLSYANALQVGVIGACATAIAALAGERRRLWCFLLPGFLSALSLFPYSGILRRAQDWVAFLHYRVDWSQFFRGYVRSFSIVFPVVWTICILLAAHSMWGRIRRGGRTDLQHNPIVWYAVASAAVGLAAQIVFIEYMKVPPFPRYLIMSAFLVALACEVLLVGRPVKSRIALALALLILTAWPSWLWLRQQRTNMDRLASIVTNRAKPPDLIVISPWFLHPSFQRYYYGSADWTTVPVLEHSPMTRYDLVKKTILDGDSAEKMVDCITRASTRGGAIWFLSQRLSTSQQAAHAPEMPVPSQNLDGYDYVRFRSFWERNIEHQLYSRCVQSEWFHTQGRPIWSEENLILTKWNPKER